LLALDRRLTVRAPAVHSFYRIRLCPRRAPQPGQTTSASEIGLSALEPTPGGRAAPRMEIRHRRYRLVTHVGAVEGDAAVGGWVSREVAADYLWCFDGATVMA
jgi:hypothetical protein